MAVVVLTAVSDRSWARIAVTQYDSLGIKNRI